MNHRALLTLLALALPLSAAAQGRLYRWVDDQGVVHYGDRVPPEYANRDRDLLNEQGIAVGFEEGEVTDAERDEQLRRQAVEQAEQDAKAEIARRDRMLLQTYLTVDDIVDLRDRRLELLESQIKVTELYLANLRKRLDSLNAEASRFRSTVDGGESRPLPADLAGDISRTLASVALYEETLSRTRSDQTALRAAFDSDIERFRELKGG